MALLMVASILLSCSNQPQAGQNVSNADSSNVVAVKDMSSYPFPYDLTNPSERFKLPDELTEISGIDVYKKSKLVCVQDEKGEIYEYDVKKGEVKHSSDFGKKGDYEAVANVNDTIYVLESSGNIFRVTDLNGDQQKTHEFKTSLNKENDSEGLCYDRKNNRLLIACKKKAGAGIKNARAIYAFDLQTGEVNPKPAYLVSIDEVKAYIQKSDRAKFIGQAIKDLLDPEKGDVAFQPSEIAIHPISGDIYLISTVGKILLVLDPSGKIVCIKELNPDIFKQPEGLTFMQDGTMYISDEGQQGHGNILKFNYLQNGK
jgi:uncharacterized protein YjiK